MIKENHQIAIFYVRDGRDRAMLLAKEEALQVLAQFSPHPMEGGPLTGQQKVFCIQFDSHFIEQDDFYNKVSHLGYVEKVTNAVEIIPNSGKKRGRPDKNAIVWKGLFFKEEILYEEDKEQMRLKDPDQRTFLLQKDSGVEAIKGYRGHGEHFGRRALPISDCRLLVNLSLPLYQNSETILLDPFAGAGGLIIEANELGLVTYSIDSDSSLNPGLTAISKKHFIANSAEMYEIESQSIDAIATEVPFEEKFTDGVLDSLKEMLRVLKPGGRLAMMTAIHQADEVEKKATSSGFKVILRQMIDRKGTDVEIFVFKKGR